MLSDATIHFIFSRGECNLLVQNLIYDEIDCWRSTVYLQSGGELENNEKTAEAIFNLLSITDKIDGVTQANEGFTKISGM